MSVIKHTGGCLDSLSWKWCRVIHQRWSFHVKSNIWRTQYIWEENAFLTLLILTCWLRRWKMMGFGNLSHWDCWRVPSLMPSSRTTHTGMLLMVGMWNFDPQGLLGFHPVITDDCKEIHPKISGILKNKEPSWSAWQARQWNWYPISLDQLKNTWNCIAACMVQLPPWILISLIFTWNLVSSRNVLRSNPNNILACQSTPSSW